MDLTTVFSAVEQSQTAKLNGAAQVQADKDKAAAIAAQLATDTQTQAGLVEKADTDINAAISVLQGLLSTAAVPVRKPRHSRRGAIAVDPIARISDGRRRSHSSWHRWNRRGCSNHMTTLLAIALIFLWVGLATWGDTLFKSAPSLLSVKFGAAALTYLACSFFAF